MLAKNLRAPRSFRMPYIIVDVFREQARAYR